MRPTRLFRLLVIALIASVPLRAQTASTAAPITGNSLQADQSCPRAGIHDQNCLTSALATMGNSMRTLVISQTFELNATLTIPPNVKLKIEHGGGFHLSRDGNLVIAGSLDAGLYQIFFGSTRNVYFFGGAGVDRIYPQWFGATGNAKTAGFTAKSGNRIITLVGQNPFAPGDAVTLLGAGPSNSPLITTVTHSDGMTLTLSSAPSTTVLATSPIYDADDSDALNAWTNSVRGGAALAKFYDLRTSLGPSRLYLPKGFYAICSESVLVYSSTVIEAEQGSTNTGGSLIQCNPAISALRISANNYDPNGKILNYGNGNSYFDHISIRGGFDSGDHHAPAVQYLNAGNLHSDNRWDHPFFERLNGFAIAAGYRTSLVGTYAAGSKSVTLADGSTFCTKQFADSINESCASIVIVGAGPGGTDLLTNVIEGLPSPPQPARPGGQPSIVTINPPIGNAAGVANPPVYPQRDVIGVLYIEHPELDVGRGLFQVQANATGDVTIEQAEVFFATHGAVNADSLKPFGLRFTDSLCSGCGTAQSPVREQSHSIYWLDRSNSRTNDVVINNVRFECANTTSATCVNATTGIYLVGGIYINGARTVDFAHNQLYDADNNSLTKSALFTNIINLNISENTFDYDRLLTNWASSVALRISRVSAVHVTNNTFNNRSGSPLPTAISSDKALHGFISQGNLFLGPISQQQLDENAAKAQ